MHFVALGHMDPNDEAFWSGIPLNIVKNLRDAGHRVTTIGPLAPEVTLWGRIKGRLYRHVIGKTYLINRDPGIAKRRARHANLLLRQVPLADAVIVFYPPDAAYLRCTCPLIIIHDATWHQFSSFYADRDALASETQSGGDKLDRLGLANCDHAIYCSKWARDSAILQYQAEPAKICVVPFGASLVSVPARDQVDAWRHERGKEPCRLLFVGVDWSRKGGPDAVAITRYLCDLGLEAELHVVGATPPGDLPQFVRAYGFLSKKDPAQWRTLETLFKQADFFVMPSRAECYGLVFAEAAAFGVPVVTTTVGGIPEILGDGGWGLALSPEAGPEPFARWIRSHHEDREAYGRSSRAARLAFEARLNWPAFCEKLVQIVVAAPIERRR